MKRPSLIAAIGLAGLLTQACNLVTGDKDGAELAPLVSFSPAAQVVKRTVPAVATDRLSAFASTLKPVIDQARCVTCHATRDPSFAAQDMNLAYSEARRAVGEAGFDSPATSRLTIKATDGHCNINGGNCPSQSQTAWIDGIRTWAQAEAALNLAPLPSPSASPGASPPPPSGNGNTFRGVRFPNVALPATVSTDVRTPTRLVFNLNTAPGIGARLAGGRLEFDVIYSAALLSNRVIAARLVGPTGAAINIENIRFLQDDVHNIGFHQLLASSCAPAAATRTIPSVLIDLPESLGRNIGVDLDLLQLGAVCDCRILTQAQAGGNARANFAAIRNNILNGKCISCHGNNANAAFRAFNMTGDDQTVCNAALNRVNLPVPNLSLIVAKPKGQYGHQPVGAFTLIGNPQSDEADLIRWIELERAARP
ncbi:MAG: hypothetical protein AB1540_05240 [Bdellovibrionota bacterium]